MSTFSLRIGTPDGLLFEGDVERVVCRSVGGDIAILARHCNFCTALGMGEASVVMEDGTRRTAACIGGTWHGRSPYYTGRRQQEECSLYRRDAFCDEWNLPPSCNDLGVERGY